MENFDESQTWKEYVRVDLLDVLLDENNDMPIIMYDNDGNPLEFEQIAVIPYGEDELYALLKPITHIDGINDDEAVLFRVDEDEEGEAVLQVEDDEEKNSKIYEIYLSLLQEAKENEE